MKKLLLLFILTIIFNGASAQDFVFKNMIDRLSISKDGQGINIIGNDIRDNLGNYFLKSSTGQLPDDSLFVHLAGAETITGAKTFTSRATFTNGLRLNTDVAGLNYLTGLSGMGPIGNAVFVSTGSYAAFGVGSSDISNAHFLTSWGYTKVKSGFAVSDDFTGVPSINAGIQLFSTTKGIQTSNMSFAQRSAIGLEPYDGNNGLLVFQRDAGDKGKGLYTVLSGGIWDRILTTADLAGGGGSSPAADDAVVHLAGTETVTGMKTFSNLVSMKNSLLISDWYTGWPSPNAGIQLLSTTKGIQTSSMTYAQRSAISLDYSDGNTGMTVYQQDAGDKGKGLYAVMSGRLWDRILTTSDLTNGTIPPAAADNTVVHLAGTETITGPKTFTSPVSIASSLRFNNDDACNIRYLSSASSLYIATGPYSTFSVGLSDETNQSFLSGQSYTKVRKGFAVSDDFMGVPSINAGIQLFSTTKGIQTSNMTYAQRNAIGLEPYDANTGLMVFQKDAGDKGKGLYTVLSGSVWDRILTTADLGGLGGASPAADGLVVHLAGTETITGAKTFSSAITGSSNLLIADSYTGQPSANAGIQLMSTTKGFQTSSMSYAQRNAINLDNYDGNTGLMVYQQDPGDRGKGLYTVKTGREWERILTTSDLSNGTIPLAGIQNQYGGPQTGNAWVSGMIRADVGMITQGIAATNVTVTGIGSVGVKNSDGTIFTAQTYDGYIVYNTNVDGGYSRYGKSAISWNSGSYEFQIHAPNLTRGRSVVFPDRSGTIVVADGNGCIVTANKVMTADGKEIFKTPNGSWKYVHVADDGSRLVDNATVTFDSDGNAYVTIP
ncbi:hypothetical protein ACFGVS_01005 [Mucilaginibacter sp. AW1-7]|uniref:hypothetical protein n=1 Tax=Mucilaginibacter sp. AW1-7 TaxID=3349874 RepID=UPI003F732B6F